MDVRAIHFPTLTVPATAGGPRKQHQPDAAGVEAGQQATPASEPHPVLSAEEQRYFESAFPSTRKAVADTPTYTTGGIRPQAAAGTLVDRKV